MVSRASHALLPVPHWSSHWTRLALLTHRVVIGSTGRASAGEGCIVPDARGVARNALVRGGVVVGVLSITFALGKSGVEGETWRAALAFLSVVVPVGIVGAGLALLGGGVPEGGLVALDTGLIVGEDGLVLRAEALPGDVVQDEIGRAGQALLGVCSPLSRGGAVHAVASCVGIFQVGRALALFGGGVFDKIEGAVALFGDVIEDSGGSAGAGALGGGDGVGRAADFVGSGFCGADGADALEEIGVEDHAGGAAGQVAGLFVVEAESLSEG